MGHHDTGDYVRTGIWHASVGVISKEIYACTYHTYVWMLLHLFNTCPNLQLRLACTGENRRSYGQQVRKEQEAARRRAERREKDELRKRMVERKVKADEERYDCCCCRCWTRRGTIAVVAVPVEERYHTIAVAHSRMKKHVYFLQGPIETLSSCRGLGIALYIEIW